MDLDLRQLRYFVAVAEELSFTRAAGRLHIAQPPLSSQIRRLEAALGVELFDRSRRAISLTTAGESLLLEARPLLLAAARAATTVAEVGVGDLSGLTVGFIPFAAVSVLPMIVRRLHQEDPRVELRLIEASADALTEQLLQRSIDAALLHLPVDHPELVSVPVYNDHLCVALPSDHPLASRFDVGLRELAAERLISPTEGQQTGLRTQIIETCQRAGFVPDIAEDEVLLLPSIVGLVASGVGVALVPTAMQVLRTPGVTFRRLRDTLPTIRLGLVSRADNRRPALASLTRTAPVLSEDPG